MLKTLKFRLLFAFGLLVYLYISVNVLLTTPIENKDVVPVELHFKDISLHKFKGSLSYNLYVLENDNSYKIGAEWADCFYYNDFVNRVKPGQLIKLSVRKHNGFLSSDLKLVVSLAVDGHNYLDINCINKEAADEKIYLPLFGVVGLIVIYGLFYYQELKSSKTKRKKKPKAHQIN